MLENADISHIEQVEEQETERIDERWEYFLNKKGVNLKTTENIESHKMETRSDHYSEEEKYNASEQQLEESKGSLAYRYEMPLEEEEVYP
jgi:flagellar biosynthesis/type III secretory pathway M-ring protein FliF/YscJ